MLIDRLIDKIKEKDNPSVAGLDTCIDYLPDDVRGKCETLYDAAKYITDFNFALIDAIKDVVPAVKVQVAYYEMYGVEGMRAFSDTLAYARQHGLFTIADVKRNDIGSTASAYSNAYLGETVDYMVKVGNQEIRVEKSRREPRLEVGHACSISIPRVVWYE